VIEARFTPTQLAGAPPKTEIPQCRQCFLLYLVRLISSDGSCGASFRASRRDGIISKLGATGASCSGSISSCYCKRAKRPDGSQALRLLAGNFGRPLEASFVLPTAFAVPVALLAYRLSEAVGI
jgi:hypothetical protein